MEREHLRGVFDYISAEIQPIDEFRRLLRRVRHPDAGAWTAARSTMRAPNLGTVLVETIGGVRRAG